MRKRFWYWILDKSKHPAERVLPPWLRFVYAVLFPLQFFFWRMSGSRGYRAQYDDWMIHGVRYSARALWDLSRSDGQCFQVWREGETLTMRRIEFQRDENGLYIEVESVDLSEMFRVELRTSVGRG